MTVKAQINDYIKSLDLSKAADMEELHKEILGLEPDSRLWFLDGKNAEGKIVSNPNIGYGSELIKYTGGKTRKFYKIGLSANTTGISVYIMGIDDKNYLSKTYGDKIGKASVTAYCIKFKSLKDIDMETLKQAIKFGFKKR